MGREIIVGVGGRIFLKEGANQIIRIIMYK